MTLLGKSDIFAAEDRQYVLLHIEEWGGDVRLQSLTGRERDEFEASTTETKNGRSKPKFENFRAKMCAACMVDENGKRIFTTRADIQMLGEKSVSALQKIFNRCQELNGMSDEDVEELTEDFGSAEVAADITAPSTSAYADI
jgi:hypothetical protein